MDFIDDRGRLFGTVNLIDAAAGCFVLLLLPLAYGSYQLFRQPPPTITNVSPQMVSFGEPARIAITGLLLRPAARAKLNDISVIYRLQDTDHAELELPANLQTGRYRLELYDEANLSAFRDDAVIVEKNLPSRDTIVFRQQWKTDAVPLHALASTLHAFQTSGWEFYSLFPCASQVCVIARKVVYTPVNH